MITPNEEEIYGYIKANPTESGNLYTLLHEIGEEAFLKVIRDADGRPVFLYHGMEDRDKDDPPIYWKYRLRKT